MKYGSKALGPLGGIVSIAYNFNSKKSLQKKLVDSAVDLGVLGASSATGAAIGTAIGGPVGTAVGGLAGAAVGFVSEYKFKNNKSIKDYAKDKANKKVNDIRNSFNHTKKKIKSQYSSVSKSATKGLMKGSAKFGKAISHVI